MLTGLLALAVAVLAAGAAAHPERWLRCTPLNPGNSPLTLAIQGTSVGLVDAKSGTFVHLNPLMKSMAVDDHVVEFAMHDDILNWRFSFFQRTGNFVLEREIEGKNVAITGTCLPTTPEKVEERQ